MAQRSSPGIKKLKWIQRNRKVEPEKNVFIFLLSSKSTDEQDKIQKSKHCK